MSREIRDLVRRMSRENTYLIGSDIGLMIATLLGPGWPREVTCQQFGAVEIVIGCIVVCLVAASAAGPASAGCISQVRQHHHPQL